MEADSCPRAELSPDYCECCAKEGKKNIKKFQWELPPLGERRSNKLMKWEERRGYFCLEGHFWEKRRSKQLLIFVQKNRRGRFFAAEDPEQVEREKRRINYGVNRQRRKN